MHAHLHWLQSWLAALLIIGLCARSRVLAQDATTLTLLSTNDVHGRLSQLPLFAGYVHNLREALGRDHVIVLDAGDIFQGTLESNLTEGAAMIRGFRALGYDAAALGNHEFDFGPVGPHMTPWNTREDPLGALRARIREAPFPMLSVNLRSSEGGAPRIAGLRRSVMIERAGVKLGIIGGITEEALLATHSANTHGLHVAPLAESIQDEATRLRKSGARVVIALVHAGGECHDMHDPDDLSSCEADSEVFRLARKLPAFTVDLIVAGHTHAPLAHRVQGVPIIEAYANGRAFGRADLHVPHATDAPVTVTLHPPHGLCEDVLRESVCSVENYAGAAVARDPRVLAAIRADLARAESERARPLGIQIVNPVRRESLTESPLNNLVADLILRAVPDADAAFSNAGALRISLPVGPLRFGTLFEMFPFDNGFATLQLTAAELAEILAHNLAASSGILSLAGVRAEAQCDNGKLRVTLLDLAGRALAKERKLKVITSDFLATQGDGALAGLALEPTRVKLEREHLIRSALVDGLRAWPGGRLDGNDKRLFDPLAPRVRYSGARPVRCPPATP